ncbi:MAG: hypothetical protein ACOYVK_18010 [Bacillota bacterium]
MKPKKCLFLLCIIIFLSSATACQTALNKTPEETVRNFIKAGTQGDAETFRELLDLPDENDAFIKAYMKNYTDIAQKEEFKLEDIAIRVIPEEEFAEGILEEMENQQGFEPVIVEVTKFDEAPLLFLLQNADQKYYIKNVDTKERYQDIFKAE